MNFDKNLIARNFSRGAKEYDEVAQVQRQVAQELVALALPYLKKDSCILDLGSGTSFIARQIPHHDITEIDLSANMLQFWCDRPSNIKAIQADFENLPFKKNNFDVIISSFALQWINDFEKNFSQFFALLKSKGIFIFSLPITGSLPEFAALNINEFPSNKTLKNALQKAGFHEKLFMQKKMQQSFANSRDTIKFLKRIGADSPVKRRLSLTKVVSKNIGITISWHISYFIAQK